MSLTTISTDLIDSSQGSQGTKVQLDPSQVGDPGIRTTWIGHATVLAEVDGAVVLCDPIFR